MGLGSAMWTRTTRLLEYGHYLLFSLGNMHRRMADDLQKSVTDKAVAHWAYLVNANRKLTRNQRECSSANSSQHRKDPLWRSGVQSGKIHSLLSVSFSVLQNRKKYFYYRFKIYARWFLFNLRKTWNILYLCHFVY